MYPHMERSIALNHGDLSITVLSFGAILHRFTYKGKNLIISLDDEASYRNDPWHTGAVIGRHAGRINSKGELGGEPISLESTDYFQLHGGSAGFSKKDWVFTEVGSLPYPYVTLSLLSGDGDSGFPGNLQVSLTYTLKENQLELRYQAETDQSTWVNLTNHTYFQWDRTPFLNRLIFEIPAYGILATDEQLLPTGAIIPISQTDMNFNQPCVLGHKRLDHVYMLEDSTVKPVRVIDPLTSLGMEMWTDQPSVVVFTPESRNSFCLEAQRPPNAPSFPNLGSVALHPHEVYSQTTSYRIFDL
jgi:aldose 1-epimerase